VVRLVDTENAAEAIRALERGWLREFGAPQRLLVDDGRAFCSQEFLDCTDKHGIKLVIAPGEAHNWLGMVERAHAVLREAIEIYLETEGQAKTLENLRDALNIVPAQLNRLMHHKSFSSTQWVLGFLPQQDANLFSYVFHVPAQENALVDKEFSANLQKRTLAAEAFLRADASECLRRAMLRRHRAVHEQLRLVSSATIGGNRDQASWSRTSGEDP
jgi:hypothetical protein